mmetsp:Transcript_8377/g.29785  ORF Transcript_8377/g.29785 Transcript_8377/m.29785 type:complete len:252 (-) Transcript_8377:178-933(-)
MPICSATPEELRGSLGLYTRFGTKPGIVRPALVYARTNRRVGARVRPMTGCACAMKVCSSLRSTAFAVRCGGSASLAQSTPHTKSTTYTSRGLTTLLPSSTTTRSTGSVKSAKRWSCSRSSHAAASLRAFLAAPARSRLFLLGTLPVAAASSFSSASTAVACACHRARSPYGHGICSRTDSRKRTRPPTTTPQSAGVRAILKGSAIASCSGSRFFARLRVPRGRSAASPGPPCGELGPPAPPAPPARGASL